jgi:septal ring-binding cell division protein DamX
MYTPQKSAPKKEEPKTSRPTDKSSVPANQTPKAADSAPKTTPASKAEPAPKTAPASSSSKTAIREQDLKAGNYVQFATCTTDAEADKIISKHKKYPIIKVLFEKREGYKLLVGPLGDDEKGAVLARFKAFGYSDAYLRKVK